MELRVFFLPLVASTQLVAAELPHLSVSEFKQQQHNLQRLHHLKQQQHADNLMLSNLEMDPNIADLTKQARCVDPYRSIPMYGWRWFQRKFNNIKEALGCWDITEEQAKMRDTSFETRRAKCIRRVLIDRGFFGKDQVLSETHVNDILCHVLTEAVRSKDPRIQFARRVKLCMREILADIQLNNTVNIEDIRLECMQKHKSTSMKPDIQTGQLGAEFNYGQEMYIQAVRTADAVLAEMNHCLRYFGLVAKEADEYERLEESCKGTLQSKRSLETLDEDTQLDICIFSHSVKGRVAKEDIEVQFECLNQYLESTSNSDRSKAVLLDLFWNQTRPIYLEQQMSCKALSGRPKWTKVLNGWNLTCERLRSIKAKRQVPEVEEDVTPNWDSAELHTPIPNTEGLPTDGTVMTTTQPDGDRFQVLEELNKCILDRIRSSTARTALKDLEKSHRQWQYKHQQCWNKYKDQRVQQIGDRYVTRQQAWNKVREPLFLDTPTVSTH
ncbi:uncharacterized protein LOC100903939 [Galendromus occidentalis]|uniref:Uncharacterized protein LOC100903939 n=1 Tax=Galendromus occidentalis TaxID=34638 RepID=A0AAJ7SEN3_9ACAR|nr:uncharacterized protein LOC100903939 [Galendromus occidentalis]